MDYESIANAFYGTPATPPAEEQSLLSDGKAPEPPALQPEPAHEPEDRAALIEQAADAFYGPSQDQVPTDGHYPEAEDLYSALEREDRMSGEEVDAQAFQASSTALQAFAAEAGLGRPHMQTLLEAAKQAMESPISSLESLETKNANCLAELRSAWGSRFDENLAYAKAEADRLTRAVPYAYEVLNMGAGSNPALVKIMADAGRARARKK